VPNNSVNKYSKELLACYPRRTFYLFCDNFSIKYYRITMTNFRSCLIYKSYSQANLYHYTQQLILLLIWIYLCTPPLLFWRRPPQSNYPSYTLTIYHFNDIWISKEKLLRVVFHYYFKKTNIFNQKFPPIYTHNILKNNVRL